MRNAYLRLEGDPRAGTRHPILAGLDDAPRIIHGTYRLDVVPNREFRRPPLTLIPSYPDLPMEMVYPRVPKTEIAELYLREVGAGRVLPGISTGSSGRSWPSTTGRCSETQSTGRRTKSRPFGSRAQVCSTSPSGASRPR